VRMVWVWQQVFFTAGQRDLDRKINRTPKQPLR
jgi:hypothetical protein